jgi:hypothetical protein
MSRRDAIAEQSLAVTLRKLIEGGLILSFPKLEQEGGIPILNPPVNLMLARVTPDGKYTLKYNTPIDPSIVLDDKALAIALAVALRGFEAYEAEMLLRLGEEAAKRPDITGAGNNGDGRRIIKP